MYHMKTQPQRLQECIQIRTQLQSLGVLSIPHIADTLKKNMNAFVTTGDSCSFRLNMDEKGVYFEVILTSNENKKSGVRMIS
jgi:hypothetical protein